MKVVRQRVATSLMVSAVVLAVSAPVAHAALTANSQLQQQINPGVLSTDVRNGSNAVVASPAFAMSAATVSTSTQTVTGTFGTSTQRISVDNPGGANGGWNLTLNATTPGTGNWTNGTNTYPYNGTSSTGQLTVDPSVSTLTGVVGSTATGFTKGSQATFTGSTPITLLSAAAGTDDVWNGYLTGIGMSQIIPAGQPSGAYTLDLTQTVAAI